MGKRVHGWQGDARWERRCTTDKHRRARATGCMAGNEMHDGRGVARLANACRVTFVWVVR